MATEFVSRGFRGRARETNSAIKERIPPGQYETKDFPVLSAGPTPRASLERWNFSVYGEIAEDLKWSWDEFRKLPRETVTVDIHCVALHKKSFAWGRLHNEYPARRRTRWKGVDC